MTRKLLERLGVRSLSVLCVSILVFACSAIVSAQSAIPDAPVLISENSTTRALAVNPFRWRGRFPVRPQTVWSPGDETRVTLFVTNLDLMKEEGANAFRADVEDVSGRQVQLTVESITPVVGFEWIYAVVIRLKDQIGDVGDVLTRVTWRGMSSNRVRLAMGHIGGGPAQRDVIGKIKPQPKNEERAEEQARAEGEIGDIGRHAFRCGFGTGRFLRRCAGNAGTRMVCGLFGNGGRGAVLDVLVRIH